MPNKFSAFSALIFFICRKRCTQLVMRILVEEIQPLSMFSTATPRLVDHKYRQVVDRPSQVHPMFVSRTNKYDLMNNGIG